MASNTRSQRIADQLQKEIVVLIQRELQDPRVGFVTVSAVKVSKDLAYADIYVSVLGKNTVEEAHENLKALKNASGFLRTQLGKALQLRAVPQLRFNFDEAWCMVTRLMI